MTGNRLQYERPTDGYEIRSYRADDRESYLELYETVHGETSSDRFDWCYDGPYLDHIPIFVVDADGTICGAEAFLPLRLQAGEVKTLALQPADAMVHPDHRRQGLFTRITEAAIEYYAEREPTHFFNFPTPAAERALSKLGWRRVGRIPTWYRIQNPRALLETVTSNPAISLVDRLARPALALERRVNRITADQPPPVEVERYDGVPANLLADLARSRNPGNVSICHDEDFYRWRFANPFYESVVTYVARERGQPVASIVAVTHRPEGVTATVLMDAQPANTPDRTGEFVALVDAALHDATASDVVAIAESTLPAEALRGRSFYSDERFPLSLWRDPMDMVVRPIDERTDGWSLGGRSLTDIDEWRVTFADQDSYF